MCVCVKTYDKLFPEQPNDNGGSSAKSAASSKKQPLTVAEELALEAAEMKTEKKKKSRFSSIPTVRNLFFSFCFQILLLEEK